MSVFATFTLLVIETPSQANAKAMSEPVPLEVEVREISSINSDINLVQ